MAIKSTNGQFSFIEPVPLPPTRNERQRWWLGGSALYQLLEIRNSHSHTARWWDDLSDIEIQLKNHSCLACSTGTFVVCNWGEPTMNNHQIHKHEYDLLYHDHTIIISSTVRDDLANKFTWIFARPWCHTLGHTHTHTKSELPLPNN